MRAIFVRHGQTVYNCESRYQGHTDAELSALGRRQASAVADKLAGQRVAAIYASDLSRARDTAEAIAAFHDLPVHIDARLRECSFGDWEGLTVTEITDLYPDLYQNYRRDSISYRAPNGEMLEDLQRRVVLAVDDIALKHPDESVIVVVHGGPIRAFLCHALRTDLRTFRKMNLGNCGVTTLQQEKDGGWFLEVLNDTCHLEKLQAAGEQHDETSSEHRRTG